MLATGRLAAAAGFVGGFALAVLRRAALGDLRGAARGGLSVGRDANRRSSSSSVQARAFGEIMRPAGKPYSLMRLRS